LDRNVELRKFRARTIKIGTKLGGTTEALIRGGMTKNYKGSQEVSKTNSFVAKSCGREKGGAASNIITARKR